MFAEQTFRADNSLEITAGKSVDALDLLFNIFYWLSEFRTSLLQIIWAIGFLFQDQKWAINLIMLDDLGNI